MSNNEQTPAEALRERFREELRKPVMERYFPEDDLINVFDTAGDVYDDYLRTEVLLMGMRLYPQSLPLLERRAIYYLDTDREMFVRFLEDCDEEHSTILDILRLNLLEEEPLEKKTEAVEKFLKDFRFDEDEEVIQFVQTLHSIGMDSWLAANLDRMKGLVSYLPSLLYEYAFQADDSNELSSIAVRVLEELTEIEPYVTDYWTMLALAYIRDERYEDAAGAVGYALAIEPDNYHALKTRLQISRFTDDKTMLKDSFRQIIAINPDDAESAEIALWETGMDFDKKGVTDLLDKLSPKARSSRGAVRQAIMNDYPRLRELLSDVYDNGVRDVKEWREFVRTAYDIGNIESVNEIMQTYQEKSGESLDDEFIILCIMFDIGQYPLVTRLFAEADFTSTVRHADNYYPAFLRCLISYLRMGDFKSAKSVAGAMLEKFANYPVQSIPMDLEEHAISYFLKDILARLENKKDKTDWDKFEPLV